jgi:micrococcal nuclease
MKAPPRRGHALGAALALAVIAVGLADGEAASVGRAPTGERRRGNAAVVRRPGVSAIARPAARPVPWRRLTEGETPDPRRATPPTGYLIHLIDGGEPIVVSRYVEEKGQVLFEKYGGWVRIPTYEILKIVPDLPDPGARTVNLPPPISAETYGAPLRPESDFYVNMQGGGNLRVTGFTPEGDRVRVSVSNGTFTVPRSEIVSVVRVPPGGDAPEAWLSVLATDTEDGAAGSAGLLPVAPDPRLPYPGSDRPHLLRLANGQLMRVEGFWVEDGEFRFRRLGGIVGVALNEVLRVLPEEIAPVRGRTPVRFVRRVAPDLLEVSVRSGPHRVRLVGVAAAGGAWTDENPWRGLEQGSIVYLEFDRQRYDSDGNWLAYVFLPNGRMLNAELIRLGLARPIGDVQNARYLDLFHEMAGGDPPSPEPVDPD